MLRASRQKEAGSDVTHPPVGGGAPAFASLRLAVTASRRPILIGAPRAGKAAFHTGGGVATARGRRNWAVEEEQPKNKEAAAVRVPIAMEFLLTLYFLKFNL